MNAMQYIIPVLLSCFTGWLVVWLCTRLLFHPGKPMSIAGLKLQGVLPANQQRIAENIAKMVSTEFLSFSSLQTKITDPENFNKLRPEIEIHIDSFLRERLKDHFPMLSMLIGNKTITQLKSAFMLELESLFPVIMKRYLTTLEKDLDLEKMITEKIAGFSLTRAEEMINNQVGRQLRKVQLFGALIGLLMGIVHMLINFQIYP